MERTEKDVEQYLCKRVKEMGGKAYKFVSPGNAGVPVRLVGTYWTRITGYGYIPACRSKKTGWLFAAAAAHENQRVV